MAANREVPIKCDLLERVNDDHDAEVQQGKGRQMPRNATMWVPLHFAGPSRMAHQQQPNRFPVTEAVITVMLMPRPNGCL